MYNEKNAKIECLISTLISTNIWIFILVQLDGSMFCDKESLLVVVFLLPIILQIFSIFLAVIARISSTKQIARSGSNICIIYSILSLILFLYVNKYFILWKICTNQFFQFGCHKREWKTLDSHSLFSLLHLPEFFYFQNFIIIYFSVTFPLPLFQNPKISPQSLLITIDHQ